MKYIFIDTETTGLIPAKCSWDINYRKFPYIVSIAWATYNDRFPVSKEYYIIKPDKYVIPQAAINIHKITNEIANADGIPIRDMFEKLRKELCCSDKVVGFNTYFDSSIIKANILRYNYNVNNFIACLNREKRIDLMHETIKFMNLPMPNKAGLRYPKLKEVYYRLFHKNYINHHAEEDVIATANCFFVLKEMGIING